MIGLLRFCFVLVAGAVLLGNASVQAQVVCPAKPHWSATTPPINIDHVFCGEVDGNRAKGFHSRPGGINPASVADVKITQEPNASGVFGATVTLVNPHGANPSKFSTMFPDSCSQAEVEKSILHAFDNPVACPAGAPHWASCGLNRPGGGPAEGYCVGSSSETGFYIAFATLSHGANAGNINTAFPLY
ncbi:EndoU domain-containing protein [Thalassospira sp. HF15]|uniref:EndoU domain-containing protein n=1 Tax=Thalassospira sp. HF15 TaxID=2722755 RepID=UPI0014302C7A|nr:EndoU domain-containing protein [Thalassospira sp. HF15]NIY75782.1 EndoU domain-containing protein [Thalassospira sp. HF15]